MSVDTAPERYRRRRRWPILLAILALAIATTVLWFQIVKPPAAAATGCNHPGPAPSTTAKTTRSSGSVPSGASAGRSASSAPVSGSPKISAKTTAKSTAKSAATPSSAKPASVAASSSAVSVTTTLGTFTAPAILAATRPADPSAIDLRVVNSSQTRGEASTLTKDLQDAGFDSIADASNDPLYPANDLVCAQEIRFGQTGLRQARTVLLVAPCAQLVMDDRMGQDVDLALGANYDFVAIPDPVKAQLKAIHDAAAPAAVIEGQTAAARPLASIPPLPAAHCSSSGAPLSSG